MVLAGGRVMVATVAARAQGVRVGLRRRDALARCPDLVVLEHDPARDARLFEPVASAVEELVPGIEIIRPGLVACDLRGPARYFGSEDAAAERLVDAVEACDVECRVGVAGSLAVAILAARRSTIVPPTPAGAAGGAAVSGADADAAFCARLPLTDLARDPAISRPGWGELVGLLARLGVTTAGQLAAMPASSITARFGPDGSALHRLASGRAERALSRRGIAADVAVDRRYDPPLDRVDTAAFAARALAGAFHAQLAARGLACTRLSITATTLHGSRIARLWRCVRPLDAAGTADRVRWQLDGWLTRSVADGPIAALRLEAVLAVDAGRVQYGLWGAEGLGEHRAGSAFARVQGLLGSGAVAAALRSGGRGPADRVALALWGEDAEPARDPAGPWPGALPAPAPALAETAASVAGRIDVCDRDGYPVDLTDRGMLTARPVALGEGRVHSWTGPWLVDERWWAEPSNRPDRRARLQVMPEPGPPVLLELSPRGWSVEAIYD